jgi:L-fuconolactonase
MIASRLLNLGAAIEATLSPVTTPARFMESARPGTPAGGLSTSSTRRSASTQQSAQKYPNVSVKLSAAPLFSSEPYPFRDVTLHIHRLFDAYGPRRCYWGTDVTNSFVKATYRQRVTHFTEELTFLSEEDKDWIMGSAILTRLGRA